MHLVDMSTLLILLSLEPGFHHPRGQDITILGVRISQSTPLRRPTSSLVNPNPETSLLSHVCVSSVVICHAM
jgi:ABC-type thiamine transport system ATPase subunit